METETLREIVRAAMNQPGRKRAKLWPNGLGFDHGRWEYTFVESRHCWQALYRPEGYGKGPHTLLGYGPTPNTARLLAQKVEA